LMPPMLARGTRSVLSRWSVAAFVLVATLPAAAHAAGPAAVTISACKSDAITVAGKVALSGGSARKARGATLEMRFQALALFGLPHSGQWRSAGKKTRAIAQQDFTGLPADSWIGLMSWRFKKGSRTVLSGSEPSQSVRVGASKGRASCTVALGAKPPDTTPPSLFVAAADGNWHRAPAAVQVVAQDNFSGVKSVRYSVDGGALAPIPNGGSFAIAGEGSHTVNTEATDVAGNTGTRSDLVRVDAAPPSKPAFSRPFSVTQSTTPTFAWSASTDSGSGMRGYLLTVRRASDNGVVVFQQVGAGTTSLTSPARLTDGETYTAVVTAVDNTADKAWTTDSDVLTFRVDSTPDVTSPQDGQVLAFEAKKAPVAVNFDRPVDPSTKNGVTLTRDSAGGGSTGASGPTCSSPCTTISFTNPSGLPEGRYTLSVDVKSEEGLAMQKTFHFAVPAATNEDSSASTTSSCVVLPASQPFSVQTTTGNETVLASFSFSLTSGTARVRFVRSGDPSPPSVTLAAGSGDQTLALSVPSAGPTPLTLEYCIQSGSGTLNLSNIWVSRAP
jgi:hypothetical protein